MPTVCRSGRFSKVSKPSCRNGAIPTPRNADAAPPVAPNPIDALNCLPVWTGNAGSRDDRLFGKSGAQPDQKSQDPERETGGDLQRVLGNILSKICADHRANHPGESNRQTDSRGNVAFAIVRDCAGNGDEEHRGEGGTYCFMDGKVEHARQQGDRKPCSAGTNESKHDA